MGFLRDIGASGVVVLVLGALILFGPKRLPELGQSIGKMINEFKKSMNEGMLEDKEEKNSEK